MSFALTKINKKLRHFGSHMMPMALWNSHVAVVTKKVFHNCYYTPSKYIQEM